jgi:hypothetical protein
MRGCPPFEYLVCIVAIHIFFSGYFIDDILEEAVFSSAKIFTCPRTT